MKALLLSILFMLAAPLSHAQVSLPITFEEPIDYELTDFGGNASQLVADPTDPNNTVVESVRTGAAECFAGTTVAEVSGFTEPIPFEPGSTKMNVRVWSPLAGVPVRFKVEEVGVPTVSVEAEVLTTVAGQWETIVYDFIEDKVPGTADINFDATYNKASIFFNFQCPSPDPVPEATYYWDDVAFGDVLTDVVAVLEPVGPTVIPITGGTLSYAVTLTNTTDQPQTFSGRIDATLPNGSSVRVRGPQNVTLAPNQTRGPFTYSRNVPAAAPEGDYLLVVSLAMGGNVFATDSFPFEKEGEPAPGISLPITFEEPIDYELTDFGGNASQLVADPTDPNNTVVESVRVAAAECFAGTTVANATGFNEPLPFAPGETVMTVRVWSPLAGVPVRFKVEEVGVPTVSVEAEVFTTVAGAWETLVYDFEDEVPGTAPINFSSVYNKASIFFNFQCPDTTPLPEQTYYWDDVAFGGGTAPVAAASRTVAVDAAYPNPFTDRTTVVFTVDATTEVRLAFYDVLGREVAVLLDGRVEAGRHEARFDARDLASGVYVWRLTAGGQAQTGRLTLAR